MPKPVGEWVEDDVLSLPQGENDSFERKGAHMLDLTLSNTNEGRVLDELAKQLSAFANTGGGQIIFGITDAGAVDNGGVARSVKGNQSTKDWLEDVIPVVTDFEIVGFNVYEILPKATGSSLAADKSLYVVEVPDSERAPHQSLRDHKYYVRLAGKSRPASHRLIEDIRNRVKHPKLEVSDLQIVGAKFFPQPGGSALSSHGPIQANLRFTISNRGGIRAANSCLLISGTVQTRTGIQNDAECFTRFGPEGTALFEFKNPIYPEMGVVFSCSVSLAGAEIAVLSQGESLTIAGQDPREVLLFITIFADSAQPRRQEFRILEIDRTQQLARMIEQELKRLRDSGRQSGAPSQFTPWS
jgi:hypothetical protein